MYMVRDGRCPPHHEEELTMFWQAQESPEPENYVKNHYHPEESKGHHEEIN